jgi:ABC-2 type transport system permease protein
MVGRSWAALGVIAGIWADKFDQLAGFQNFLIMPLTMLSGVFYSIHSLPRVLAAGVAFQSRLLYDRRLSLRLLRRLRRLAVVEPGRGRWLPVLLTAFTLNLLKRGYKLRA